MKIASQTNTNTLSLPKLNPRGVLISEFPAMQGGYLLAWHLARQFSRKCQPTAMVDLAPSASRLPAQLARLSDHTAMRALQTQRPLWSDSPHGRSLAPLHLDEHRAMQAEAPINIIAQPAGAFPLAEQMPRICEQLLRTIAGRPPQGVGCPLPWSNVVFLSEPQGIPLDASCWQSADAVVLLLPPANTYHEAARVALSARLPNLSASGRVLALWQQPVTLSNWFFANKVLRLSKQQPSLWNVRGIEHFRIPWPTSQDSNGKPSGLRMMAQVARLLAVELDRIRI